MKTNCLYILLMLFLLVNIASADIKTTRSTDQGLTIEYRVENVEWKDVRTADGSRATLPEIDDAAIIGEQGKPALVSQAITVGIPLSANPTVNIIGAEYNEIADIAIAPYPTMVTGEAFTDFVYERDEDAYGQNTYFPSEVLIDYSIKFVRKQRILQIQIAPLQYNPSTNIARLYENIRLEVSFNAARGSKGENVIDKHFEKLYQNLLINYDQAKHWRMPPAEHQILRQTDVDPFSNATEWYKIHVTEAGIYKLTYQALSDAGVNVSAINPEMIRMFNAGGKQLPEDIHVPRPEFKEIAIKVVAGDDGEFNPDDYILFWGVGTSGWEFQDDDFEYYDNRYTDTNIYWFTYDYDSEEPVSRMEEIASPNQQDVYEVESFSDYIHIEENRDYTPRVSIYDDYDFWTWETLQGTGEEHVYYPFILHDVDFSGLYRIYTVVMGGSKDDHKVNFQCNDTYLGTVEWPRDNPREFSENGYANEFLQNGQNEFELIIPREPDYENDIIKFNYFEVKYSRLLKAFENKLHIRMNYLPAEVAEFRIQGFDNNQINVFEVTDKFSPIMIEPKTIQEKSVIFQAQNNYSQREFIAISESRYKTPALIEKDEVAHLRLNPEVDLVIITHDDFYTPTLPLKDHEMSQGLDVTLAKLSDVMDEFAWGVYDPTAIRDYLQFAFDNWTQAPGYLLFVGDGHYDYRGFSGTEGGNYIPPHYWEGAVSSQEVPVDDWYCYLDTNAHPDSVDYDNALDMALGRLPVNSTKEVEFVVSKIEQYEGNPEFGTWRNKYVFCADDEYQKSEGDILGLRHIRDTEKIATTDNVMPERIIREKVYLTEYELVNDEKQAASDDLIEFWNDGALGINFIGHGNSEVWAHEWALKIGEDIARMENGNKLPITFAASCDVGRFDNVYGYASLGEKLLIVSGKGAIGSLCSARSAYSGENYRLNRDFFKFLFENDHNPNSNTIGTAFMYSKLDNMSDWDNDRLYYLFGSPTLNLAVPQLKTELTAETNVVAKGDTLGMSGYVLQSDTSEVDINFNGLATIIVTDAPKNVDYESPLPGFGSAEYVLPGKTIFRGLVEVEGGYLSSKFIIPMNARQGENCRITSYVWDGDVDGSGYLQNIEISGEQPAPADTSGPIMSLYYNGKLLRPDANLPQNAELTLVISDPNGIDITETPGSQISVEIDGDVNNRQDITGDFIYDLGDHTTGRTKFRLSGVGSGQHTLKFRSFDSFGNGAWQLDVNGNGKIDDEDIALTGEDGEFRCNVLGAQDWYFSDKVANYPNPFDEETYFFFDTASGIGITQEIDVTIKIYTVAGRLIKTIEHAVSPQYWDGRDEDGDEIANGTYLYKVIAKYNNNTKEVYNKLVIMR